MNLSLIKIHSIFPHFNETPLTAEDFWRVVKREKIIVHQMPLLVDGYYTVRKGRHYILINSQLTGPRWLHVALHELYHFFFDVPCESDGYAFYRNGQYVDRREYRADAFALIGIMPWPELMRILPEDLSASPWLADIVRDRIVVRTHFGI
jgi:Zn-dependent peptidase ImmA (M78 family)